VAHRVGSADQIAEGVLPGDFLPQDAIFALDMKFFDGAFEQMPKNINIDGFDEVVVRSGVDDFQGCGLGFVRAKNDDQCVDVSARQAFQQMRTFANTAGTDRQRQKQNVEFRLLQEFVRGFVIVTFENFKVRAQARGNFRAQGCVIVNDCNLRLRGNGRDRQPPGDGEIQLWMVRE